MRSSIYFQGAADVALGRRARARLDLGDAPQVAPLRELDIDPDPVFTAFLPTTHGVLDDHFECWFLTSDGPTTAARRGPGVGRRPRPVRGVARPAQGHAEGSRS